MAGVGAGTWAWAPAAAKLAKASIIKDFFIMDRGKVSIQK
jgi:hypothetical protein